MDPQKLSMVEAEVIEWQQDAKAFGKFHPERVPEITIPPAKKANDISAAVSPDFSYRLVSSTLKDAQSEILLYIYNVSADYMVSLLEERKNAGVDIQIMYDTTDTRGKERQKLQSLGASLKEAPSSKGRQVFTVCHQKFAVIDEKTLLIGSANWATTSIPQVTVPGKFKKGNREWLLRIDDAGLAKWFKDLFLIDWEIPELPGPTGAFELPEEPPGPVMVPSMIFKAPDKIFDQKKFELQTPARVTPIISPDNYFDLAKQLILDAQESIYVQQQYILAGGPKTEGLLEALEQRKDEVEIHLIVSPAFRKVGKKDNWELSVDSLDAYGLKDRLRAMNLNYYTHCHNKGLIVDRNTVIVSSTNWSENSIVRAREAGVIVESPDVSEYFAKVFDFDWEIGWDPADVPENLLGMFSEAMFQPDAFEEIHPADLA